jgi:hypothetical protein
MIENITATRYGVLSACVIYFSDCQVVVAAQPRHPSAGNGIWYLNWHASRLTRPDARIARIAPACQKK